MGGGRGGCVAVCKIYKTKPLLKNSNFYKKKFTTFPYCWKKGFFKKFKILEAPYFLHTWVEGNLGGIGELMTVPEYRRNDKCWGEGRFGDICSYFRVKSLNIIRKIQSTCLLFINSSSWSAEKALLKVSSTACGVGRPDTLGSSSKSRRLW